MRGIQFYHQPAFLTKPGIKGCLLASGLVLEIFLLLALTDNYFFLSTAKQRVALSSRKSDFNRRIANLKQAEVPFTEDLSQLIQLLRKDVTSVVRDQRKYSARSVENIRQLQGRVIGTCSAILAVYYEE